MSALEAVVVGLVVGMLATAIRVACVLWSTRINTFGDYLVCFIVWWRNRRH